MAHEIVIPRLGWSMEEGVFVRWLKRDGDTVRPGDMLFELEGEKALQEIEAIDGGILRIPPDAPAPGDVVVVGKVLGYLVTADEAVPWLATRNEPASTATNAANTVSTSAATAATQRARNEQLAPRNTTIASPRARRIAKELNIDWRQITGSGGGGRIRERDVRAVASTTTKPGGLRLPISKRRRVIAERLLASRQQTVPVTLTTRADATRLVALREQLRADGLTTVLPSYQDIIVKLVATTLQRHPLLAARWDGDAIVLPADDGFDIGLAVDTEEGLLVPVVRDVPRLALGALAERTRELIEQTRSKQLAVSQMQGGVFTITNLGAFGIDAFTPIINHPESAILGLGAIRREPVVADDGEVVVRSQITLSLTFDHRLSDGAPAARFLQELVSGIANPEAALPP